MARQSQILPKEGDMVDKAQMESVDLGSHRQFETRGPEKIAWALLHAPTVPRHRASAGPATCHPRPEHPGPIGDRLRRAQPGLCLEYSTCTMCRRICHISQQMVGLGGRDTFNSSAKR